MREWTTHLRHGEKGACDVSLDYLEASLAALIVSDRLSRYHAVAGVVPSTELNGKTVKTLQV